MCIVSVHNFLVNELQVRISSRLVDGNPRNMHTDASTVRQCQAASPPPLPRSFLFSWFFVEWSLIISPTPPSGVMTSGLAHIQLRCSVPMTDGLFRTTLFRGGVFNERFLAVNYWEVIP